ncbi:ABC transporter ATP-binding protein/permease [Aestuariivirga sp.]|uniref:ABC transporter ATP-binding protein/permease n=1 Tax=Aestuariivirga sp. TaxID=2650926 RepID=UPI0039E66FED
MSEAFWNARERNALFLLAAAIIAVVGATAWFQIKLNAWNQPFYDAITKRNMDGFLEQLGVFAKLAAFLLALNVAQAWLREMAKLVLRKGLVHDLLSEWLKPQRAFALSNAGTIGQNPDQRIAADAQQLTELTTNLGIGLLQSTLLLGSFIEVLWQLSSGMSVRIGSFTWAPPGFMVWCALFYAGIASFVSWMVGRPLVRLDTDRYAQEADFRFSLVRANEDMESIALFGGEAAEDTRIRTVFTGLTAVMHHIVNATTRLTWVTAGYGWFTIVAPILVAAPSYFHGKMSFGELMMIVGAFNQVQSSLRWFVDNFSSIADWRATLLRVASFREALRAMDDAQHNPHLSVTETRDGSIGLSGVSITSSSGSITVSPPEVRLAKGERAAVTSQQGAGKTLLFRTLAGLWPWFSGHIEKPPGGSIMFVPQRAYVPPGTLRACVSYPKPGDAYPDKDIRTALTDVGLERLIPSLDRYDRWDRQLSENDKQMLSFARLVLHHPDWAVIEDVLDRIDPHMLPAVTELLNGPLAAMGMIVIGSEEPKGLRITRHLSLVPAVSSADQPANQTVAREKPRRARPSPTSGADMNKRHNKPLR